MVSKKARMSRSTTQSFFQHRFRHVPTASSAERPRSVAVGVGMEQGFHLRLQIRPHDRLGDPVSDGGHTERPHAVALLRYLDGTDR